MILKDVKMVIPPLVDAENEEKANVLIPEIVAKIANEFVNPMDAVSAYYGVGASLAFLFGCEPSDLFHDLLMFSTNYLKENEVETTVVDNTEYKH